MTVFNLVTMLLNGVTLLVVGAIVQMRLVARDRRGEPSGKLPPLRIILFILGGLMIVSAVTLFALFRE